MNLIPHHHKPRRRTRPHLCVSRRVPAQALPVTHRGFPLSGMNWVLAIRLLALLQVALPKIVQNLTLRWKGNEWGSVVW